MLLSTDHNKLLIKWKGPFEVNGYIGGNNYQIKINRKLKTFHINLLKQYVEKENVEMTATSGRRDFPGETRGETGIEVQGVQGERLQAVADGGLRNIVVGRSDYVKKQKDFCVDYKKLMKLGVLRPKESISDLCLEVELSRKQPHEIIGVLGKSVKIFTDVF